MFGGLKIEYNILEKFYNTLTYDIHIITIFNI